MKLFNKINIKTGISMVLSLVIIGWMGIITSNLYGKIKIPVEIKVKIQDNAVPGIPLNIIIDVLSKMPFKNGHIELILPEMGSLRSQSIELWSGDSDTYLEKHLSYLLAEFAPGEYEIRASFKFTSTQDGEQEMGVMEALYIDARLDKILTSNISFTHIKQLELKEELERKGLKGLSLGQIKEKSPEMAERIMNLNRLVTVESQQQKEEKSNEMDIIQNPEVGRSENPNEDRVDNHSGAEEDREVKNAPLIGTIEAVSDSRQPVGANKEEKEAFRAGKAPLIGTIEVVPGSNQAAKENTQDNEKKESLKVEKAPLISEMEYISVPNQPQGPKDTLLVPAKAPLESTLEIVDIKIGEKKKEPMASDSTNNDYKNSAQANEKRKALEKK